MNVVAGHVTFCHNIASMFSLGFMVGRMEYSMSGIVFPQRNWPCALLDLSGGVVCQT